MTVPARDPDWATVLPALPPASWSAYVRTARPKQWLKNILVFAAPGAAGDITHPGTALRSAAMFGLFCLASASTYYINDVLDIDADRIHPTKRWRPIASGQVKRRSAWVMGLAGVVVAAGLSALLGPKSLLVVGLYLSLTLAYSLWLKREPVLEMGVLTGGFILRAVAGGVATGIPLSDWFLIVASFGSLFMVGGKRYAEYQGLGEGREEHRLVLGGYSMAYLRHVRSVASAVTTAGYCLWAFEKAGPQGHTAPGALWFQLSIAPFVLALLRYALVLEHGRGGAPEDVVTGDRILQLLGLVWLVCFALGVYGA
jgi:decaprenyl-phosphate phosphoribosyltransferase